MRPLPPRRRVLVDTAAYFALANPRDASHAEAHAILERLSAQRYRAFTTNFILAELHAVLLTRVSRQAALRVLMQIDESTTVVVRVSARDERRARDILRQYGDKDFSLTDATSFAVMERLRIPYAFSFDRHFSQYGLIVLTPTAAL